MLRSVLKSSSMAKVLDTLDRNFFHVNPSVNNVVRLDRLTFSENNSHIADSITKAGFKTNVGIQLSGLKDKDGDSKDTNDCNQKDGHDKKECSEDKTPKDGPLYARKSNDDNGIDKKQEKQDESSVCWELGKYSDLRRPKYFLEDNDKMMSNAGQSDKESDVKEDLWKKETNIYETSSEEESKHYSDSNPCTNDDPFITNDDPCITNDNSCKQYADTANPCITLDDTYNTNSDLMSTNADPYKQYIADPCTTNDNSASNTNSDPTSTNVDPCDDGFKQSDLGPKSDLCSESNDDSNKSKLCVEDNMRSNATDCDETTKEFSECKNELNECKNELDECNNELEKCKNELDECKNEFGECKNDFDEGNDNECKDKLEEICESVEDPCASKEEDPCASEEEDPYEKVSEEITEPEPISEPPRELEDISKYQNAAYFQYKPYDFYDFIVDMKSKDYFSPLPDSTKPKRWGPEQCDPKPVELDKFDPEVPDPKFSEERDTKPTGPEQCG